MFNRREQVALLFLTGSLLVGTIVSALDYYRPEMMEDFRVIPGAVPVPVLSEAPGAAASIEPAPGSAAGGTEPAAATAVGPVDVNGASAVELESLPQIGPATAARILAYRREHGPFQDLDDLRRVSGIGERTVAKLRPHAVARPPH